MSITVRRAAPDDAAAISTVWAVVCAERVYTAVEQPFSPDQERAYLEALSDREAIFVAEDGGDVVGFQSLDRWADYTDSFAHVGVIGTIVHPEWRRRGVGRRLAARTFAFARAHGYEKLVIYVRAGNEGARAFYRRLGFRPKGVLERQVKIDGRYEDEVFMEHFL